MEVKAQITGLRLAPRKVRAAVNLIKKKDVSEALNQLHHMTSRPAPHLVKLINSAVANAENTYHMVKDNLYIKDLIVDEGVKLKRYMPRAQGRATEIQKKTCYVRLRLDEKVAGMKRSASAPTPVSEGGASKPAAPAAAKPEIKQKLGVKKEGGIVKRFFQRKSV